MKYIALVGAISSFANIFLHYGNDAAMWGWLSSTAWCVVAVINEFTSAK